MRRAAPSRRAQDGALGYEQAIPAESVSFGLIAAEASRRPDVNFDPTQVLSLATGESASRALQFGGKASTGRGLCRMVVPA